MYNVNAINKIFYNKKITDTISTETALFLNIFDTGCLNPWLQNTYMWVPQMQRTEFIEHI